MLNFSRGKIKSNLLATSDPTVNDDSSSGYRIGSFWINIILNKAYICVDNTEGSAVWNYIGAGTGLYVTPSLVYNNTDTTINLTTSNLNTIYVIENVSNVVINCPSVDSGHIGSWMEVRKKGAGNITINRADSDLIVGGTSIANTEAAQTYAFIRLLIETATSWGMQGSLGSWTTS
jgi:hypothetical protein